MLQLVRKNADDANANHSCGVCGCGYGHILLVLAQTYPAKCRRLRLGDPSGGEARQGPEPIRYVIRAVSPARCVAGASVLAHAAGNCRGFVLRDQLDFARLRTHARKLWQAAGLSRLSLLGRPSRRPVVNHHCGQRVFPGSAAGDDDEAAGRTSGIPDKTFPSRNSGLRNRGGFKYRRLAAVATLVAAADTILRTLHSPFRFPRTSPFIRIVPISRSRRLALAVLLASAPALVL